MTKRSIWGLIIVGVGLLALAGSLGYIETDHLWSNYWPVIFIGIGLANLVESPKNFVFSGLTVVFGTVMLLNNLGYFNFSWDDVWAVVWPVIIIAIGLQLLINRQGSSDRSNRDPSNKLDVLCIFSGVDISNNSPDFSGGDVVAIFGGAKVDLRPATIVDRPVRLDVVSVFGGAEIIVPSDWNVKVTGVPIFGGWENKTSQQGYVEGPLDLEINAVTIFGGLEVKNHN